MKLSEFKEKVTQVLRERSINAISKLQQKNLDAISKALEFYKKNKHTDKKEPFIKLLKKLGKEKESLAKELDMKVSGMYKNAEYKGESVEESVNEGSMSWEKHFKGYNEKELKVISKLIFMNPQDIDGVIKMSKKKDFKPFVQKAAKKGLGESINEGPSTEEKRIAMLAVRKQAKYRNVSLSQAIQDQINALEELKRQYKGK